MEAQVVGTPREVEIESQTELCNQAIHTTIIILSWIAQGMISSTYVTVVMWLRR